MSVNDKLYDHLIERVQSSGTVKAAEPSGFSDTEIDHIAEQFDWRPVWSYPKDMINECPQRFVSLFRVEDEQMMIGIRAGGGIPAGQRSAQKGAAHNLTIVFNGCVTKDIEFIYDGGAEWSYYDLCLPDGLRADDVKGFEVEKDGRLLYSGVLDDNAVMQKADIVNVVRIKKYGFIEGWATSRQNPGEDVFLWYEINQQRGMVRTGQQWRNEPLRHFRINAPIEKNLLGKISVMNFAGEEGKRSPVWRFWSDKGGFVIANPRRKGDQILLTIVGQNSDSLAPASLRSDSFTADINLEDGENFGYYDKRNTVSIPISILQSPRKTSILNQTGDIIGTLPDMTELLDEVLT